MENGGNFEAKRLTSYIDPYEAMFQIQNLATIIEKGKEKVEEQGETSHLETILPLYANLPVPETCANGNTEEQAELLAIMVDASPPILAAPTPSTITLPPETYADGNIEEQAEPLPIMVDASPPILAAPTPSPITVLDAAEIGRCFFYGAHDGTLTTFTGLAGMAAGGAATPWIAAVTAGSLVGGALLYCLKIWLLYGQPVDIEDQYVKTFGDRRRFYLHLIITIFFYVVVGASPLLSYYLFSLLSKRDYVVVGLTGIAVFGVHIIVWAAKERRWGPVFFSFISYLLGSVISYLGSSLYTGAL